MSWDKCNKCEKLVNTDNEPEAYIEIGNMRRMHETICLCRACREEYEDDQERYRSETGINPDE